jgi:2-iminobutanoate/2-iminopropanoate deaminase
MKTKAINASDAPAPRGGYAQAFEIAEHRRLLFISGQVPTTQDDRVPDGFAAQCRQAWANVDAQLRAAGMTRDNLVKVTTFLSDRKYGLENRTIRQEMLAGREPALTVVITGIFDAAWLLEIEAIAAA